MLQHKMQSYNTRPSHTTTPERILAHQTPPYYPPRSSHTRTLDPVLLHHYAQSYYNTRTSHTTVPDMKSSFPKRDKRHSKKIGLQFQCQVHELFWKMELLVCAYVVIFHNTMSEFDIGIAKSISGLSLMMFWKRVQIYELVILQHKT